MLQESHFNKPSRQDTAFSPQSLLSLTGFPSPKEGQPQPHNYLELKKTTCVHMLSEAILGREWFSSGKARVQKFQRQARQPGTVDESRYGGQINSA